MSWACNVATSTRWESTLSIPDLHTETICRSLTQVFWESVEPNEIHCCPPHVLKKGGGSFSVLFLVLFLKILEIAKYNLNMVFWTQHDWKKNKKTDVGIPRDLDSCIGIGVLVLYYHTGKIINFKQQNYNTFFVLQQSFFFFLLCAFAKNYKKQQRKCQQNVVLFLKNVNKKKNNGSCGKTIVGIQVDRIAFLVTFFSCAILFIIHTYVTLKFIKKQRVESRNHIPSLSARARWVMICRHCNWRVIPKTFYRWACYFLACQSLLLYLLMNLAELVNYWFINDVSVSCYHLKLTALYLYHIAKLSNYMVFLLRLRNIFDEANLWSLSYVKYGMTGFCIFLGCLFPGLFFDPLVYKGKMTDVEGIRYCVARR
ncbi:hypothetical protein RFI_09720 [Reticulomyxa filosa]|uniref:Uncharacterized protein n=1 Tax=Reticulomyxa filosa TaxID=46433 RepID=X6NPZ3_RETFI|nr:hypothetical protein RFI_09720 [Reticulomyxa filosa]|eukprot:ETO27412.1 hypothetical protein RFI_09720 [Reticulomyxa filosa]